MTTSSAARRPVSIPIWSNLPIRLKLILIFIIVVTFVIGMVSLFRQRTLNHVFTLAGVENLKQQTAQDAKVFKDFLEGHINTLNVVRLNSTLQNQVGKNLTEYTGTETDVLRQIQEVEKTWKDTANNAPLVETRLTNMAAAELRRINIANPDLTKIVLLDSYGAVVAANVKPDHFWYGNTEWWKSVSSSSLAQNEFYISQPKSDPTTGFMIMEVATPVFNLTNDRTIGVLLAEINVQELVNFATDTKVGQTGHVHWVLDNNQVISHEAKLEALPSDHIAIFAQAEKDPNSPVLLDGESQLISNAAVTSETIPQINALNWKVYIVQSSSEVLSLLSQVNQDLLPVIIGISLITILAAVWAATGFTRPIRYLTQVATTLGSGNLNVRANVGGTDELATLGNTLNTMADALKQQIVSEQQARQELQRLNINLEEAVTNRTSELGKRASELETVTDVSAEVASVLSIDELLQRVVDLTKQRFNLYHAHIYLLDETGQTLNLAAGAGEIGRIMVAQGRQISVNREQSLVASAARNRQGVIANDVTQNLDFLPNPLLPETRSEMAVPIMAGSRVFGVLDVQSNQLDRFSTVDVQIQTSLANQIAVAIQNAQAYTLLHESQMSVERRASELESVAQVSAQIATVLDLDTLLQSVADLTKSNFNLYHVHIYLLSQDGQQLNLAGGAGEIGRMMKMQQRKIPFSHPRSLVASAARSRQAVMVNDVSQTAEFLPNPLLPETRSEMAIPIITGDQLLGVLDVQADQPNRFTEQDLYIQTVLANQVAVAIQNAEVYTKLNSAQAVVERRASELETVSRVSAEAASVLDINELLQTVSDLARDQFGLYHAHIYLLDETGEQLKLAAGAGEVGRIMTAKGRQISLNHEQSLVALAARSREGVVANNVMENPNFLPNPLLPETRSEMAVPIIAVDRLLGVLDVQSRQVGRFTEEDVRIKTALANQVAVAIQNAEAYTKLNTAQAVVERRASELETVSRVSAEAASVLDIQKLLQTVSDLVKERFDLYHAHIYLLDPSDEVLILSAGAGRIGRVMAAQGRKIPLQHEQSLVALAARTRDGVIANDVRQNPNFLPNPLLPETRSEMAVPIVAGDRLLGVLDVQARQVDRFSEEDVRIQTALANQVAVAIQNAESYTKLNAAQAIVERRASELETVSRVSAEAASVLDIQKLLQTVSDLAKDRFGLYHAHIYLLDAVGEILNLAAGSGRVGRIMATQGRQIPVDHEHSLVASAARSRQGIIANDVTQNPDFLPNPLLPETRSEMAVPIIAGNRLLGVLDVQSDKVDYFTENDVEIQNSLANQVAVAIQNAEAYTKLNSAQTVVERRAAELEAVARVSAEAASVLDINDLLQTVSDLAKDQFGLYHAHIYLLDEPSDELRLTAGAGDVGRIMTSQGRQISRNHEHSLVALAARTQQGVIANDVTQSPDFLPNPLLPDTRAEMAVPIMVGNRLLGVLDVQADKEDYFTPSDVQVYTSLANQTAVAIQNAQLFSQTLLAQTVLDSSSDSILVLNSNGEIVYANPAFTRMFGYTTEEVIGQAPVMLQGEESDPIQSEKIQEAMANRTPVTVEIITYHQNGNPFWAEISMTPVFDRQNELSNYIMMQKEISERKLVEFQREEMLRFAEEQAEMERASAERLREVDRLKSEFMASMSHELRTPLNSIIGYAEVLLDGIDGDLTDDAIEDAQAIHDSGQHLLVLINDVLDLAKIEAGRMELDLEAVPLHDVIEEIQRLTRVLVKDKSVELVFNIPDDMPALWADRVRLRQILNNLISNAVKFTDTGEVVIKAQVLEDKHQAVISVRDSGIGIAPQNLGMIFEQFRQVDGGPARRVSGTGLGLPITRHLVEMHDGEIWVESTVGVGSTFSFTVPLATETKEA